MLLKNPEDLLPYNSQKTNPIKPNFKIRETNQRSGKKKGCQELFYGSGLPERLTF